jgi:hypothetical protein
MIPGNARTSRRLATPSTLREALPIQVRKIIAIARLWDLDPDYQRSVLLPCPRSGWAQCFELVAERGFLSRVVPLLSD